MPPNSRAKPKETAPPRCDSCTCGSLRKASRRVSQFYDQALAPMGIKITQYAILSEVDRGRPDGPVTMRELATAMIMDRSTLGHTQVRVRSSGDTGWTDVWLPERAPGR